MKTNGVWKKKEEEETKAQVEIISWWCEKENRLVNSWVMDIKLFIKEKDEVIHEGK